MEHSKAAGCLVGTLLFVVEWILTIKKSKVVNEIIERGGPIFGFELFYLSY